MKSTEKDRKEYKNMNKNEKGIINKIEGRVEDGTNERKKESKKERQKK